MAFRVVRGSCWCPPTRRMAGLKARSLEPDRLVSCSLLNVKFLIVRYAEPEDV